MEWTLNPTATWTWRVYPKMARSTVYRQVLLDLQCICTPKFAAEYTSNLIQMSTAGWLCGNGSFGQLGTGTNVDTSRFCPPKSAHNFAKLAIGTSHCAGVTFMGELYCFGLNDMSQCGIRSDKNDFLLLPVHVNLENDLSLTSTTV
jgi:alpha-tubulin suppressor-like RCC1 family protein